MTYDGVDIGEAIQPIQDRVVTFQSNGYAVVSPGDALSAGAYAVTVNSGDLNASDTLSVGSSNDEILFDGSTKSLSSATNITINGVSAAGDGTEQYRYDVIYADSSGEVQKTEGSVTKLDSRESQNNLTRFERFKGAIPNPGTDPSVIIAAVIVNSNDTSVGSSQLRDYRVPATTTADTVDANTVNTANLDGGVTSNTTVSNIIGSGVEVVSGSLQAALGDGVALSGNDITAVLGDGLDFASGNIQILNSIWDAANTELTADVNNSNTTTGTLEANTVNGITTYAGSFSGADPDARLDSALSAATDNDEIVLEKSTYTQDRTISQKLLFKGTEIDFDSNPATIDANWTLDVSCTLESVRINQKLTINGNGGSQLRFCTIGDVDVSGSSLRVKVIGCNGTGTVTFASGASSGIVDGCTGVGFVDNDGGNTQGDIA